MRNALPDDGILVDEVTQIGFASRLAFPVYARTFLSPGYQDNLGWGYGTALGVRRPCRTARPVDRRRWRLHVPGSGTGDRRAA